MEARKLEMSQNYMFDEWFDSTFKNLVGLDKS